MLSVCEPLGTLMVCETGKVFDQVVKVRPLGEVETPGRLKATSYDVPGVRFTIEPRHSLLDESNHRSRPCDHDAEPATRYFTWQPVAELAPGLDQYRPTASYVGTARTPLESRVC